MREGLRRELLAQKVIDAGSRIEDRGGRPGRHRFLQRQSRAVQRGRRVVSHRADRRDAGRATRQLANRTGDDATTPQAATAKVQMLMERLKGGASFGDLATGYSEDPESAPRGGDLGLVPVSRLKQAPPALRDAVLNKGARQRERGERGRRPHARAGGGARAGGTARPVDARGARAHHRRRCAGARSSCCARRTSPPRGATREVVNYLARRLVESNGAMPSPSTGRTGDKIGSRSRPVATCGRPVAIFRDLAASRRAASRRQPRDPDGNL